MPSLSLGQTKVNESKKPPADNLRPNREFPTTRRSPREPRDASDRAARAIFEIQGRTPLHIRVTAFDTFDGVAWHEAPVKESTCLLDREPSSSAAPLAPWGGGPAGDRQPLTWRPSPPGAREARPRTAAG